MEMSEHIRIKHVLENSARAMKDDHELLKKGGHNRPYEDHMVNQAELKIMSYTCRFHLQAPTVLTWKWKQSF